MFHLFIKRDPYNKKQYKSLLDRYTELEKKHQTMLSGIKKLHTTFIIPENQVLQMGDEQLKMKVEHLVREGIMDHLVKNNLLHIQCFEDMGRGNQYTVELLVMSPKKNE